MGGSVCNNRSWWFSERRTGNGIDEPEQRGFDTPSPICETIWPHQTSVKSRVNRCGDHLTLGVLARAAERVPVL